jgi:hypothetical protein
MILYEGASKLDGSPIVAIATTGSKNSKTGDMVQVWILPADIDPLEANRTGKDFSICGNCPLKGEVSTKDKGTALKRACYVLIQNAPLAVWKKYKKGGYEKCRSLVKFGTGRAIRLGAYGDPAAIPPHIIKQLLKNAITWTGYTHQIDIIKGEHRELMLDSVMVSVETLEQAQAIWSEGGRTFRVTSDASELADNEILCPSDRVSCRDCGLCKGRSLKAKSIVIEAHGAGKKNSLAIVD